MKKMNKTNKTINDYYQAEMQLLNDAVQDFCEVHPAQGARLNLDARGASDPHIERLLEGSAHLHARIKQQIDFGVHHVSEALVRQLAPQYLTPYPSMTIIEYTCPNNRLIKSQTIPAGISLDSRPVGDEKTCCKFTTTQGLTIHPLRLVSVENLPGLKSLQLTLKLNEGVDVASLKIEDLPFYINGSAEVVAHWYYYLTSKISKITIKHEGGEEQFVGEQAHVSCMHFHDFQSMLPPLPRHIHAFELLSDYFQFPEKFCFVKLKMLNQAIRSHTFKIIIEFSETLDNMRASNELLKLHCVPASNVFSTHCEPIRYSQRHSEYPLVISRDQPVSKNLLAIKQVSGINKQGLLRIDLFDFHQSSFTSSGQGHYRLSQCRENENNQRSRLIFSGSMPKEMHISCDVYASNGYYPWQYLPAKALHVKDDRVLCQLEASNLIKPSRFYPSLFNSQSASNILSSVHLKFQMLADPLYLKKILHLHDGSEQSSEQIEAINAIELKSFNRLNRGMITRGVTFSLTIDETVFSTLPKLYLLGTVVHHFIQHFAPLNTKVETTFKMMTSGRFFEWK